MVFFFALAQSNGSTRSKGEPPTDLKSFAAPHLLFLGKICRACSFSSRSCDVWWMGAGGGSRPSIHRHLVVFMVKRGERKGGGLGG
jgi:hypothetical protein